MSNALEIAVGTVQSVADAKQIGCPVALRAVAMLAADSAQIEQLLAALVELGCPLISSSPRRVFARRSNPAGPITALVSFAAGETALLTAGIAASEQRTLDLVLVGNTGVAVWEDDPALEFDASTLPGMFSAATRSLLAAIDVSLAQGRAADVNGSASPSANVAENKSAAATDTSTAKGTPGAVGQTRAIGSAGPARLGVLLVTGAQTHQENYAAALAADKRVKLIGVTDEPDVSPRRRELNQQLADEFNIPHLDDLDAALTRDDVQVVSVCAPPERRASILVRAAQAGKHLYLDKPLAANMEEADAIVTAIEQAGVVSQMFSQVHTANAQRIRRVLESGRLGELQAIHCDLTFAKGHPGKAELGRPRQEAARPTAFETDSKRELYNIGVYSLVMMHWLLGRTTRSVFATTGNYFFAESHRYDMVDFGQMLLEFTGGITASVSDGRTGWRTHPSHGWNKTWLIGTQATICVDAFKPRVSVWAETPGWQPPSIHPEDPLGFWSSTVRDSGAEPKATWQLPAESVTNDAVYFLDCISAGRESDVPARLAADVLEDLLAGYRSAAEGDVVRLPVERLGAK